MGEWLTKHICNFSFQRAGCRLNHGLNENFGERLQFASEESASDMIEAFYFQN